MSGDGALAVDSAPSDSRDMPERAFSAGVADAVASLEDDDGADAVVVRTGVTIASPSLDA